MKNMKNKAELETAMRGYFGDAKTDDRKKEEYGKYLKLRIRPLMEMLIEEEDIGAMEQVEACGWFGAVQLDGFIKMAGERRCLSSFAWLLNLKTRKYGYQDKDFSL